MTAVVVDGLLDMVVVMVPVASEAASLDGRTGLSLSCGRLLPSERAGAGALDDALHCWKNSPAQHLISSQSLQRSSQQRVDAPVYRVRPG